MCPVCPNAKRQPAQPRPAVAPIGGNGSDRLFDVW
jgi:hypothetical protein